ncbi:MAG: four-carbon acid sugar kinase family protein [Sphaerochaetaceae bacterium]|jgi:uncharacterized protein YgbK (DUF1537 family)|nr:hypothetical protein [Bacteroidia bacterium]
MIIIADDLTGASDSAIQFSKEGFKTIVFPNIDRFFKNNKINENYNIISINTDTRNLDAKESYETVYKLSTLFKDKVVFKKIDSLIRGNPGIEIEAVMDGTKSEIALIAPSFPENDRFIENGLLDTESGLVNVVEAFQSELNSEIIHVPLSVIRGGFEDIKDYIKKKQKETNTKFVLFDATSDSDLELIYKYACYLRKKVVLVGSGGFAKTVAKNYTILFNNTLLSVGKPRKESNLTLAVIGSITKTSKMQLKALIEAYPDKICLAPSNLLKVPDNEFVINQIAEKCLSILSGGSELLVISLDSILNRPKRNIFDSIEELKNGENIGANLGKIVLKVYEKIPFQTIITTGGDISLFVCSQLEVKGIEPIYEIEPGIPLGRIIGGIADNSNIVTKSGSFGNKNSLVNIVNYFIKNKGDNQIVKNINS